MEKERTSLIWDKPTILTRPSSPPMLACYSDRPGPPTNGGGRMTRTTRISALLALTVLTSITIVRPTAAQSKDEQAIREAGQAWQRYTARQQIDSIVGMHTSDAILMLANSPVIKGSAGIRSGWAEM